MVSPLTAADDEDIGFDIGADAEDDMLTGGVGYAVQAPGSVLDPTDLSPVYDAALQRLRAQRSGLSGKQRLGALLVGFGQPTRHGKWQEGAANAALMLSQQTLAAREQDEKRRLKLEELMTQRDIAGARSKGALEIARMKAGQGGKLNADQVKRMGYAQTLFPDKSEEELRRLLYSPKVDYMMMRGGVAAAAASQGLAVGDALHSVEDAIAPPPPPGATVASLRQEAIDAIAKGAPRDGVLQRLRSAGVPTEGI